MKKVPVLAALTLALLLISCGDSSTTINGGNEEPHYGGDPSSSSKPSSSSTPQTSVTTANAVVITLTYWTTTYTEFLSKPDPEIYFVVSAAQNGTQISSNKSAVLLRQDNIESWTGRKESSPIPFAPQADSLAIKAVVVEKDAILPDTDISPGQWVYWKRPLPSDGYSNSTTLNYGSGKSTVNFDYKFIRQ